MKKILFLYILLIISNSIFGQQVKKYPYYILPNQKIEVYSIKDTLWVITHKQLKKTIKVSKKLKIEQQQNTLLKMQIDTLKAIIDSQKVLIDTLKSDKKFYQNAYNQCEQDLTKSIELSERYNRNFKYAIYGGISLSVITFFLGAYLFH